MAMSDRYLIVDLDLNEITLIQAKTPEFATLEVEDLEIDHGTDYYAIRLTEEEYDSRVMPLDRVIHPGLYY